MRTTPGESPPDSDGQANTPHRARKIIYHDDLLIAFAERLLPGSTFSELAHAIGVAGAGGAVLAAVVFDRFTDTDCEISIVSDAIPQAWVTREFLFHVAAYPFLQLHLARVTCFIDAGNTPALRWAEGNGFVREGKKRHRDSRKEVVMLGLLREECRWLPGQWIGHLKMSH